MFREETTGSKEVDVEIHIKLQIKHLTETLVALLVGR